MADPVAGFVLRRRLTGGDGPTEVWEAVRDDGLPLALKRYLPREDAPEGAIRFRTERELLARLGGRHHLIRCLGSLDDPPAILLEWAGGGNLRDRLHPWGRTGLPVPLSEPAVIEIARQVGDALGWLHANAVIHRDVKPSNLLRMGDGSVRLADLSVAATGTPPRGLPDGWTEEAVGTLGYAAPELLRNPADATPAVDLYSLGATLYELLTGHLPYDLGPAESELDYRARIVGGEAPVPLARRGRPAAARLGAVIMTALEPEPARRHRSIDELLAAL